MSAKPWETHRRVTIYGERPLRSFEQAAARYLRENADKRSLDRDDQALRLAMPHLGHHELGEIHYGKLQTFADARLVNGVSKSTVNRDMAAVKQVLKAAARWFHENGQPWLTAVPEVPARVKVVVACFMLPTFVYYRSQRSC